MRTIALLLLIIFAEILCGTEIRTDHVERHPSITPDGKQIVYSAGEDEVIHLYIANRDGSAERKLTENDQFEAFPAISPDSKEIVFSSRKDGANGWQLSIMNMNGKQIKRITTNSFSDCAPSFSPRGDKVVFARAALYRRYSMGGFTWDKWDIYTINSDGSDEQRITFDNYRTVDAPYFSPDGKKILFGCDKDDYMINTIDIVPNATPKQLNKPPLNGNELNKGPRHRIDAEPSWSPDGKQIVFVSNRVSRPVPYDYEIWLMNADGTGPKIITHTQSYCASPIFSPDGNAIMYVSDPDRNKLFSLWEVSVSGANAKVIRAAHSKGEPK
jgi:TolB protein